MHIVLQSGSNVILKKMNRKYTRQVFFDTIDRLRAAHSDFTFTTDVIVGFPGETEQDFAETIEAMRYTKFAKVHMFPYSDRPRTRSALMPNKVPHDIMKKRKHEVLRVAEETAYQLREQFVNRTMTVLTESPDTSRPHETGGHTENFLMVWTPSDQPVANQMITVKLIENTPAGLIGRKI
jgi:threonylcarbamoyladenosine tRNA methylthiotransferase MtaB